uniref:Uncharacterized protein n=1 Tax=Arundo donax TaxID=35708 RepID=A0A0A8Z0S2_ARUDO
MLPETMEKTVTISYSRWQRRRRPITLAFEEQLYSSLAPWTTTSTRS